MRGVRRAAIARARAQQPVVIAAPPVAPEVKPAPKPNNITKPRNEDE